MRRCVSQFDPGDGGPADSRICGEFILRQEPGKTKRPDATRQVLTGIFGQADVEMIQ